MKMKTLIIVVAVCILLGSYMAISKFNEPKSNINSNVNSNINQEESTSSSTPVNQTSTTTVIKTQTISNISEDNQRYRFIGQVTNDLGSKKIEGVYQELFSVNVRQNIEGNVKGNIILSNENCKTQFAVGRLYDITATHDIFNENYKCLSANSFPAVNGGNQ
ncbi:hypothetical protein BH11PAT2_BH11PAT2_06670 [soil metagenome]